MAAPIIGLITKFAKLLIPVSNAKTVASICFGVILAKRTIPGILLKAIAKVSATIVVKNTKIISLIPKYWIFHLITKITEVIHPKHIAN